MMRTSTKLRCVRIGSQRDLADMETSANSLMENKNLTIRSLCSININIRTVYPFTQRVSVLMGLDALSDTMRELSKMFTSTIIR